MRAAFVYELPDHVPADQRVAIDVGLRGLFPGVRFEFAPAPAITGRIIPIVGLANPNQPDSVVMDHLPPALVLEVKAAFAGLLIDALAGPGPST